MRSCSAKDAGRQRKHSRGAWQAVTRVTASPRRGSKMVSIGRRHLLELNGEGKKMLRRWFYPGIDEKSLPIYVNSPPKAYDSVLISVKQIEPLGITSVQGM